MLHTVLDQHTAQCLYPFILSLLPSLHSVRSFLLLKSLLSKTFPRHFLISFLFNLRSFPFPVICCYSLHCIILSPFHRSIFFVLFLTLCPSNCLSVCLCAICSAWCECLALEETGVSLCVRNLTAQITWHNETWQITAAVQKLTVLSERHWKWAEAGEGCVWACAVTYMRAYARVHAHAALREFLCALTLTASTCNWTVSVCASTYASVRVCSCVTERVCACVCVPSKTGQIHQRRQQS